MPANVIFRCDASASIGAGHMMRCFALAETMASFGFAPHLLAAPGSVEVLSAVGRSGFPVYETTGSGADVAKKQIGAIRTAIVDGYGFDDEDEAALAEVADTVIAFEDMPNRPHAAKLLVDPTPGRDAADYAGLVPVGARVLTGSAQAILRPVWRLARQSGRDPDATRIVVSMGATDSVNATAKVIEAVKASGVSSPVDIVLGAAAPHIADVRSRLSDSMTLHIDASDMPLLLKHVMLAIGAPGSSSFERAVLGIPSILVQTADNQRDLAHAFDAAGAAWVSKVEALDDPEAFGAIIAALLADVRARAAMSTAAASLCDGRGALRLLASLAGSVCTSSGSTVQLRLAEAGDAAWLLELQRQPETRRFARTTAAPTEAEHTAWYARLMDDPDRVLLIVESDGAAKGFVRLDRCPSDHGAVFEVSVAIDPASHGLGFGAAALRLARNFAPGATFDATVFSANAASEALFVKAGYRPVGPDLFRSLPN